ncbi:Alpha/Beta hydrolase protein [Ochromonadaceae sp. CCMP2298]|nr:Alpha/Beta hydrolase protein [Ochromonadaceae sp. CCMP2298]
MGNASSSGAVHANEPASADPVKPSRRSSRSASSSTPLTVVKDNSTQTATSLKRQSPCNAVCMFLVLAVVYFGLCLAAIFSVQAQGVLVFSTFVKNSKDLTNLLKMDLPQAKNIQITTEDGVVLKGWHMMPPGAEVLSANQMDDLDRNTYFDQTLAVAPRVVVYFHGNSNTRGQTMRVSKIKHLATYLDAHIITFDYRGFADSQGSASEHGTALDSRAVVRYLDAIVRRYNPKYTGYLPGEGVGAEASEPMLASLGVSETAVLPSVGMGMGSKQGPSRAQPLLYLYGHSLGTAIATALAVELDQGMPGVLAGLMLDSPFTTMPEAARNHPLSAPFRLFPLIFEAIIDNMQIMYPTIERVASVGAPLLIFHGDRDIKIDMEHSRRLFQVATNTSIVSNGTVRSHAGVLTPAGIDTKGHVVELHIIQNAGHCDCYASRQWLHALPSFVQRAEKRRESF